MKILHITAVRTGSTGRTASDLKAVHKENGNDYVIAFSLPDSKPLDGDILIGNNLDHKVHALLSRLLGLQGYFSFFATKRFLKIVNSYHPDVVVMGNLHANYINLPLLFKFLARKRIPVVMILHDCWFFTGKCTHFAARGCEKWKARCQHCPALKADNESWLFDCSTKMFYDRKKWYEKLSSQTVVAVSDWEKGLALKSPLFKSANVVRIHNWINTEVFKPSLAEQKLFIAEKYHLSQSVKYLISVSDGWSLHSLKTSDAIKLSKRLPKGYKLIVVGNVMEGTFDKDVVSIPHTYDQVELSVLYSLSVAYLHFSTEDTFGKVIAEAMACKTVPIVFDSTACGETASPYGIAVQPHDIDAMVAAIPMAEEEERKARVRDYAINEYNKDINSGFYCKLFKEIKGNAQS